MAQTAPAAAQTTPAAAQTTPWPVDLEMIAKIREEGLQRSQLPNTLSYLTDVLGARLTNSDDMRRAQAWVVGEMERMGLENVAREPFMEYGVSWDNEYVSLHMLEPDYSPLVGYPIAHTPGTDGRQRLRAVIGDVHTRADLAKYRGRLRGMAVLSTPPPVIDIERFETGTPRRTDEELRALAEDVIVPPPGPDPYFGESTFDVAPLPRCLSHPILGARGQPDQPYSCLTAVLLCWPWAPSSFRRPDPGARRHNCSSMERPLRVH